MSKENEKKLDEKKDFCPSSEVPTLRWFQSTGAGQLGAGLKKNKLDFELKLGYNIDRK